VVEGTAKALVVNIGQDTEFGKIASLLIETKPEATPLQKQISKLSIGISIAVTIIDHFNIFFIVSRRVFIL